MFVYYLHIAALFVIALPPWVWIAAAVFPIASILLILVVNDHRRNNLLDQLTSIPGPKRHPIIGTFQLKHPHQQHTEVLAKFKPVAKITQLFAPAVISRDALDSRSVLLKLNLPKGLVYDNVGDYLGKNGIITLQHGKGNKWVGFRHILNQAFKPSVLRDLQPLFQHHADVFVERMDMLANTGKPVDFMHEAMRTTLNVIADVIGTGPSPPEDFMESLNRIVLQLGSLLLAVPYGGKMLRWLYRKDFEVVNGLIYNTIAERRARGAMSVDGDDKDNDGDSRRRVDLLDTLLFAVNEKGEALTDSELCDQLYAFFLAGVETTATTMSWVIWEMCKQPALTQELYNEVDSIPYPIGNDAHRKAPILTATFNEVLRLYPPVPNLCRQTLSPVAGLATYPETIIPTGMQVIVSIYDLLRDPRYWSEPDKFDLTRWLDTERAKSINTNAYIPFSSGPRICIGKQFFYLEGATLMYTLLRRFRFEATNNPMNGQLNSATGLLKPQAVEVYIYRR